MKIPAPQIDREVQHWRSTGPFESVWFLWLNITLRFYRAMYYPNKALMICFIFLYRLQVVRRTARIQRIVHVQKCTNMPTLEQSSNSTNLYPSCRITNLFRTDFAIQERIVRLCLFDGQKVSCQGSVFLFISAKATEQHRAHSDGSNWSWEENLATKASGEWETRCKRPGIRKYQFLLHIKCWIYDQSNPVDLLSGLTEIKWAILFHFGLHSNITRNFMNFLDASVHKNKAKNS